MKKVLIFTTIIILSISSIAKAQQMQIDPEVRKLFLRIYPNATAEYVFANAKKISVTDMRKKQTEKEYMYLKGDESYKGQLHNGDTVMVFDNKAFFSFTDACYLTQVEKQKEPKAQKPKLSPEERQQNREVLAQAGSELINLARNIILSKNSNTGSSGSYGYSGSY